MIADRACAILEQAGIGCWIAHRDLVPGSDWGESINDAIRSCQALVLIFSENSNKSSQVRREVALAATRDLKIISLRIEDLLPTGALEYFLSTTHWLEAFEGSLEPHLDRLCTILNYLAYHQPETEEGSTKLDEVPAAPVLNEQREGANKEGSTPTLPQIEIPVEPTGSTQAAPSSAFFGAGYISRLVFQGMANAIRRITSDDPVPAKSTTVKLPPVSHAPIGRSHEPTIEEVLASIRRIISKGNASEDEAPATSTPDPINIPLSLVQSPESSSPAVAEQINEPTMEEILASIQRIISEDDVSEDEAPATSAPNPNLINIPLALVQSPESSSPAVAEQINEPTMEEILASIRRIISEDDVPEDEAPATSIPGSINIPLAPVQSPEVLPPVAMGQSNEPTMAEILASIRRIIAED